jgi:4-amino-4-deoxy-L-arabinose transferase-like glycosyltransferase
MSGIENSEGPVLPGCACSLPSPSPEPRWRIWLRANRVPLLFALLLLAVLPMRDLWAPDEPDFAQCVREMRETGAWLLPSLNGQPYAEKPILFYWLMKGSAILFDRLTGGWGFVNQVAAWALRLPTVLASIAFLFGFRRWTARFLQADLADLAAMILAAVPIWLWQSQTIQIDLLFAALLAWSWLCWLGGYLLIRDHARPLRIQEEKTWFLGAYLSLGLAFLAKGPLALVLTLALLLAFLAWQRDFRALRAGLGPGLLVLALVVLPWYLAAALKGGAGYAYALVVHQNLERAVRAWDHQQPIYRYLEYLAGDFFPWTLLLPALVVFLVRGGARRSPSARFLILAALVPILLLSLAQSKQGKYILMIYPFLALLLAALLQPLTVEAVGPTRLRRLGGTLAAGLLAPGLALTAVLVLGAGGARLQGHLGPFLGPLRLLTALFLLGGLSVLARTLAGEGRFLVRETALTLCLVFLVVGTWGFRRLDPQKSFRRWAEVVRPLIRGRQVYFWQTLRSGVLIYSGDRMPELRSRAELDAQVGPGGLITTMASVWEIDAWGLDAQARAQFEVVARVPTGQDEAILLRRRSAKDPR